MIRRSAWRVALAVLFGSVLVGCGQPAPPMSPSPSPTVPPPTSSPTPSAAATATPSAAPSSTASPQAVLPNPGGTCSADTFVITAPATAAYGYGNTSARYFRQPLRNTGGACVIRLPKVVGVAGPDGRVLAVSVVNAGHATSFNIKAGQALAIELGAWWPLPNAPNLATWCKDPVLGVTRASFPLATGVIAFDLGITVRLVCPSPASMSVTVTP